jgi:hypothetical protein
VEVEDGYLYTVKPTPLRRLISAVKNSAIVFYTYYAYSALTEVESDNGIGLGKELYSEMARQQATGDRRDLINDFVGYRDFVKRVVGQDTLVAFVHIPLSFVVHPADAARFGHLTHANPDVARAETLTSARALIDHGIPLVDPTEALIAAGAEERMYYWLDIHFTPAGNRVAMEQAWPFLQQLIDQDSQAKARLP